MAVKCEELVKDGTSAQLARKEIKKNKNCIVKC